MNDNQDHFNVLRKINNKPKSTQRELAKELRGVAPSTRGPG